MQYLRDRMDVMKKAMLKPPGRPNTLFDSTVMEKLRDPEQRSKAGACCATQGLLCVWGRQGAPRLAGWSRGGVDRPAAVHDYCT